MLIGWLKEAESLELSEQLVSLTLTGNFGKKLKGKGTISWVEGEVSLKAWTDGAEEIRLSMASKSQVEVGKLLPDEFFYRLEAVTQTGQNLIIERVMPDRFSIHSNSEDTSWDFRSQDLERPIRMTDSIEHKKLAGKIEFFLFPDHVHQFPRTSETVTKNPRFGSRSSTHDWLQFVCSLGEVSARKRPSGVIHVRIQNSASVDLQKLQAIRTAFCFLTGKFTNFQAMEIRWGDKTERFFGWPVANSSKNRLSPPLGIANCAWHMYETFLSKLTDYFLTERGGEVAGLIYACQDSADNNFTTHAMVVCASVEALLKPYSKNLEVSSGLSSDDKTSIVQFCKDQKFTENIINRLSGFMGGMESPSVDQVFRNWMDESFIGVTKKDHAAWKSLRNSVMHGQQILYNTTKTKTQKSFDSLNRLRNLFNKIILHEAGYDGQFYDYANHENRTFGSPDSSSQSEEEELPPTEKSKILSDEELLKHLRRVGMTSFVTHFESYRSYAQGKSEMDKTIKGASRRFGNAKVIFLANREHDALRLIEQSKRTKSETVIKAKRLLLDAKSSKP